MKVRSVEVEYLERWYSGPNEFTDWRYLCNKFLTGNWRMVDDIMEVECVFKRTESGWFTKDYEYYDWRWLKESEIRFIDTFCDYAIGAPTWCDDE